MKYPKIKNALLCRAILYTVIIGIFVLPLVITACLDFIPDMIKLVIGIALAFGLLVYLINNFVLIMAVDSTLTMLHCQNTARKRFVIPKGFSVQKVNGRLSRFSKACVPSDIAPKPEILRYKSCAPMTVYSSGIEKIIVTYSVDNLDKESYRRIVNSAVTNSRLLAGKTKHRFIDKEQKDCGLNRVTVIIIYAKQTDKRFEDELYDTVCKNGGDGFDVAILPCVVDMQKDICTFDSMRIIYMGFQYPVKNRGIRIIKKYLFGGRLPLDESPDTLDIIKDLNAEQSLFDLWKSTKKELIEDERHAKAIFEKMKNDEVVWEDGYLYIKHDGRGVCLLTETDVTLKRVTVDSIDFWDYPKKMQISKDNVKELKRIVDNYYLKQGYTAEYISYE